MSVFANLDGGPASRGLDRVVAWRTRAGPACSRFSGRRTTRRAFLGLAPAVPVALCGASARAAGAGEVARSQYALSVLFADRYADRFRCRLFKGNRGGFQWEAVGADGKWRAVDITVVQAAAAELGARVFHATGADGEPYPAPDVGGSLETARAVLGLAYHRMLAR